MTPSDPGFIRTDQCLQGFVASSPQGRDINNSWGFVYLEGNRKGNPECLDPPPETVFLAIMKPKLFDSDYSGKATAVGGDVGVSQSKSQKRLAFLVCLSIPRPQQTKQNKNQRGSTRFCCRGDMMVACKKGHTHTHTSVSVSRFLGQTIRRLDGSTARLSLEVKKIRIKGYPAKTFVSEIKDPWRMKYTCPKKAGWVW